MLCKEKEGEKKVEDPEEEEDALQSCRCYYSTLNSKEKRKDSRKERNKKKEKKNISPTGIECQAWLIN